MTVRPTLLAGLTGHFSRQPGMVATEALGHILSGSESAKNALQSLLRTLGRTSTK